MESLEEVMLKGKKQQQGHISKAPKEYFAYFTMWSWTNLNLSFTYTMSKTCFLKARFQINISPTYQMLFIHLSYLWPSETSKISLMPSYYHYPRGFYYFSLSIKSQLPVKAKIITYSPQSLLWDFNADIVSPYSKFL